MNKCGNCCYGVMTGPNRMFCSAQNCSCEEVFDCEDYDPIVKPPTNADRIRAMTDEELARMFAIGCHETRECPTICNPIYPYDEVVESCEKCWLEWMKEEAADKEGEK